MTIIPTSTQTVSPPGLNHLAKAARFYWLAEDYDKSDILIAFIYGRYESGDISQAKARIAAMSALEQRPSCDLTESARRIWAQTMAWASLRTAKIEIVDQSNEAVEGLVHVLKMVGFFVGRD